MPESQNLTRFLNPWVLHLQKLALELKCPLCLNLLNRPTLLPCNHIFCNPCTPRSTQFGCECPLCKHQYIDGEQRAAPYMENTVNIYRSLDATLNANLLQPVSSDSGRTSEFAGKRVEVTVDGNDQSKSINVHKIGGAGSEEIDMNHVSQLSPGSPPSSAETRDTGGNGSYLGSSNSKLGKYTSKRLAENSPNREGDAKRQKNLNSGFFKTGSQSDGQTQSESLYPNNTATDVCQMESNVAAALPTAILDSSDVRSGVCAFCHSSKLTEGTGKMVYYSNGKEVSGDVAISSKVIAVHRKCIDWTPQVYYQGETIKNLNSELARAAKLKCSGCGQKGAALGCFHKSCRKSYHVPCAFENRGCRWDCEAFLVLCPSHNAIKFPREKSKSGQHDAGEKLTASTPIISEQSRFWAVSPNGVKNWVLCGSALSSEEKRVLINFARVCRATVVKFWEPRVTHVIAATDERGACTRTLKVLMAVLNGRWILTMNWIKACMEAMNPINEETYEVALDNHGCCDGPKTGRLRALNNAPKLFNGLNFYFLGDFLPLYKTDLLALVETGGGTTIQSKDTLVAQAEAISITVVVYNSDLPQVCKSEEEKGMVLSERLVEAEALAAEIGSRVVRHTWILDSIAAGRVQPFCS